MEDAAASRVHVLNEHPSRSLNTDSCRRVVVHVVEGEGLYLDSLTVVLTNHATVRDLNRQHAKHDYETDVLAFDYAEREGVVDGEVYVDLDMAHERHPEFGATFEEEALRYVVHGVLHLAGYDDGTDEGRRRMRALEDLYMKASKQR